MAMSSITLTIIMTKEDDKKPMKSFDELFPKGKNLSNAKKRKDNDYHKVEIGWLKLNNEQSKEDDDNKDNSGIYYWWPVKSISNPINGQVKAEIYGDDGHGYQRHIELNDSDDFLTFKLPDNKPRFNSKDSDRLFYNLKQPPSVSFIQSFELAIKSAIFDINDDDDDDLPDITIAHHVSPPLKKSDTVINTEANTSKDGSCSPTSSETKRIDNHQLDTDINVEDKEGVLAKWNRYNVYWPARVISFEPQKPRPYLLEFSDGRKSYKSRKEFFTSVEKGFGNCKLGEFELVSTKSTNLGKSETQLPEHIPNSEEFSKLPLEYQVKLCLGFMDDIINERYKYSKKKHVEFMKGGDHRKQLSQNVNYGYFSSHRGFIVDIIKDYLNPSSSDHELRRRGSNSYEELLPSDRISYMLDILLPEMLVQIVIHSEGLNESEDLNDDEKYIKASEILRSENIDNDWVNRVLVKRQFMENNCSKNDAVEDSEEEYFHNSGRPMRKRSRKKL